MFKHPVLVSVSPYDKNKKYIEVQLPGRLDNVDYSWLFDQFSKGIRKNIVKPGYVDIMQADFSTTTEDQLISSQIMIMASLQEYFDFGMRTWCGIPGVEMKGTLEDWNQLVTKTENLMKMLEPLLIELKLNHWFSSTFTILKKLVETYQGNPDKGVISDIKRFECFYTHSLIRLHHH